MVSSYLTTQDPPMLKGILGPSILCPSLRLMNSVESSGPNNHNKLEFIETAANPFRFCFINNFLLFPYWPNTIQSNKPGPLTSYSFRPPQITGCPSKSPPALIDRGGYKSLSRTHFLLDQTNLKFQLLHQH